MQVMIKLKTYIEFEYQYKIKENEAEVIFEETMFKNAPELLGMLELSLHKRRKIYKVKILFCSLSLLWPWVLLWEVKPQIQNLL